MDPCHQGPKAGEGPRRQAAWGQRCVLAGPGQIGATGCSGEGHLVVPTRGRPHLQDTYAKAALADQRVRPHHTVSALANLTECSSRDPTGGLTIIQNKNPRPRRSSGLTDPSRLLRRPPTPGGCRQTHEGQKGVRGTLGMAHPVGATSEPWAVQDCELRPGVHSAAAT